MNAFRAFKLPAITLWAAAALLGAACLTARAQDSEIGLPGYRLGQDLSANLKNAQCSPPKTIPTHCQGYSGPDGRKKLCQATAAAESNEVRLCKWPYRSTNAFAQVAVIDTVEVLTLHGVAIVVSGYQPNDHHITRLLLAYQEKFGSPAFLALRDPPAAGVAASIGSVLNTTNRVVSATWQIEPQRSIVMIGGGRGADQLQRPAPDVNENGGNSYLADARRRDMIERGLLPRFVSPGDRIVFVDWAGLQRVESTLIEAATKASKRQRSDI
jgi:hypothetical protein